MSLINLPQDIRAKLNVIGLDRLKEFRFAIQIDGDLPGAEYVVGFNGISGIGDSVRIKEVNELGYPGSQRFPRKSNLKAITVKRGMSPSRFLYDWYKEVINYDRGKPDYRRTLSIFMIDSAYIANQEIAFEVWRFNLLNAWPSAWNGPELNSTSENIAFESLIIQHSGISVPTGLFSGKTGEIIDIVT